MEAESSLRSRQCVAAGGRRGANLHFSQALILGVFVLVLETRLAFSMGVLAGGTLLRPRYGLVP
ncbi:MAG: hypothetical protein ACLQG3_03430, partial [Terracidiphilus sp.]